MSSILTSIKKALGIAETDTNFDPDIILHTNGVFMSLNQLGIGPTEGFVITDKTSVWADLLGDRIDELSAVQSYVYLKVRLLFDPPTNSFIVAAMERQILEFEWRLNVQQETVYPEEVV